MFRSFTVHLNIGSQLLWLLLLFRCTFSFYLLFFCFVCCSHRCMVACARCTVADISSAHADVFRADDSTCHSSDGWHSVGASGMSVLPSAASLIASTLRQWVLRHSRNMYSQFAEYAGRMFITHLLCAQHIRARMKTIWKRNSFTYDCACASGYWCSGIFH